MSIRFVNRREPRTLSVSERRQLRVAGAQGGGGEGGGQG